MTRIRDLIIVLPGITGSVLAKDGKEVWAASGQALWQAASSGLGSLRDLALSGVDDPQGELGDGVRATRLIDDIHIVPGIHKIDGYTELRRLLTRQFEVVPGDIDSDQPANYFEFPYDWRRDNRVSARRLQHFIETRLPRWREFSGASNAKTILIGHSMGGLISRYYLEVLGGWQDCKLLVTFGTPFRGSLKPINYFAHGMKLLGIKFPFLTQMMKSFPSVYQLLPRYPAIKVDGQWLRVTETDVVPGLPAAVAKKGLSFMYDIDAARTRNEKDERYRTDGYQIIPVVGTHQHTLQSAHYQNDVLDLSAKPPLNVTAALATGDGTVPRVSAVPIELSHEYRDSFQAEKHASLQSNANLLSRLAATIATTQSDLGLVKGGDLFPSAPPETALSLTVGDLYPANSPITVDAERLNGSGGGDLVLSAKRMADGVETSVRVTADDGSQQIELPPLVAGTYRLTLAESGGQATPVHDVFAVVGDEGA
ncbi:MAG: lecithin--cholesterol acyltransferase [Aestuariibacter sp.]|nr:lecithin--cholesterol acyltransferase [Aestuariibacter sp.]